MSISLGDRMNKRELARESWIRQVNGMIEN